MASFGVSLIAHIENAPPKIFPSIHINGQMLGSHIIIIRLIASRTNHQSKNINIYLHINLMWRLFSLEPKVGSKLKRILLSYYDGPAQYRSEFYYFK